MTPHYLLLWVLSSYFGRKVCWFVGFMSAFTAPTPRGLYGLTPIRRELMG